MNRIIKFRGKRISDGEWVYGCLITTTNTATIIPHNARQGIGGGFASVKYSDAIRVDLKTVGQYTGFNDKDGKEIYEGDVCEVMYYNHSSPDSIFIQLVGFEQGTFTLKYKDYVLDELRINCSLYHCNAPNKIKVIGTVHDNPELL